MKKNFFKFFVVALFIFVFSSQVWAEEIPPQATVVAEVNLQDAKILSQQGNVFKISFDIANGKGIQAGVRYGVKLISQTAKGQFLVDEKLYPENLSLSENSLIGKEITYEAPANLTGEYMLLVYSENESNFPFGILFVSNIKLTSSVKGIYILPETCSLKVDGEKSGAIYNLVQGVDVAREETLVLNCTVINSSENDLSVISVFETTNQATSNESVLPIEYAGQTITFKKGEQKTFSVNMPKVLNPQAYDTKVSLKSGENVSNKILVHYVVSGISATVKNLSIDKDYYQKGDTALLSFVWAGRADNFPGSRVGPNAQKANISLIAKIANDEGKECAPSVNQTLSQDAVSSKVEIPFSIISSCINPQVSVMLTNSDDGKILDQKSINIKTTSEIPNQINIVYILALMIILAAIVTVMILKKKKNDGISGSAPLGIIIPFFALLAFGTLFMPESVKAAETFTVDGSAVSALVTITMEQVFDPGETISISATMQLTACDNITLSSSLSAKLGGTNVSNSLINEVVSGVSNTLPPLVGFADFTAPNKPGRYYIEFSPKLGGSWYAPKKIYFEVKGEGICKPTHYNCEGNVVAGSTGIYDTNNEWVWSCQSYGGIANKRCTEAKYFVNGECGTTRKTCISPSTYKESSLTKVGDRYKWICQGAAGGVEKECFALESYCGSQPYSCVSPALSKNNTVSGDYYLWRCYIDETNYSSCNIYFSNVGKCNLAQINGCSSGSLNDIEDDATSFNWICKGASEELNDNCSLLKTSPHGTLNANSCEIQEGESTCSIYISWEAFNSQNVSVKIYNKSQTDPVYKYEENVKIGEGAQGEKIIDLHFSNFLPATISLYNGDAKITNKDVSATCASGMEYRNNKCQVRVNTNNPPDLPVIDGPQILSKGQSGEFKISAIDPEGKKVRYGIDWEFPASSYPGNYTVDEWLPAVVSQTSHYTESGTILPINHSWSTAGSKTFYVKAQDYLETNESGQIVGGGNSSEWKPYTVQVVEGPTGTLNGNICKIKLDESSCTTSLTLNVLSPKAGKATNVTKPTNVEVISSSTINNTFPKTVENIVVNWPSTTFYLNHDSNTLAAKTINAICDTNLVWNGTKCINNNGDGDGDGDGGNVDPNILDPDWPGLDWNDPSHWSSNDLAVILTANPSTVNTRGGKTELMWAAGSDLSDIKCTLINNKNNILVKNGSYSGTFIDAPTEKTSYRVICKAGSLMGWSEVEVKVSWFGFIFIER